MPSEFQAAEDVSLDAFAVLSSDGERLELQEEVTWPISGSCSHSARDDCSYNAL